MSWPSMINELSKRDWHFHYEVWVNIWSRLRENNNKIYRNMELAIQVNNRIIRIRSKVSLKSMTFILVSLLWSSHFLAVILFFFWFEHFNACWVAECRLYERLTTFSFQLIHAKSRMQLTMWAAIWDVVAVVYVNLSQKAATVNQDTLLMGMMNVSESQNANVNLVPKFTRYGNILLRYC